MGSKIKITNFPAQIVEKVGEVKASSGAAVKVITVNSAATISDDFYESKRFKGVVYRPL